VGGMTIPRHLSGVAHELPAVSVVETGGMLLLALEPALVAQFELNRIWFRNGILHAN
jgi:hypothetical protein